MTSKNNDIRQTEKQEYASTKVDKKKIQKYRKKPRRPSFLAKNELKTRS